MYWTNLPDLKSEEFHSNIKCNSAEVLPVKISELEYGKGTYDKPARTLRNGRSALNSEELHIDEFDMSVWDAKNEEEYGKIERRIEHTSAQCGTKKNGYDAINQELNSTETNPIREVLPVVICTYPGAAKTVNDEFHGIGIGNGNSTLRSFSASASASSSPSPSSHPSASTSFPFSFSTSTSSSSSFAPSKCPPLHYGPDVYDLIEVLHDAHIAHSSVLRNFENRYVRARTCSTCIRVRTLRLQFTQLNCIKWHMSFLLFSSFLFSPVLLSFIIHEPLVSHVYFLYIYLFLLSFFLSFFLFLSVFLSFLFSIFSCIFSTASTKTVKTI